MGGVDDGANVAWHLAATSRQRKPATAAVEKATRWAKISAAWAAGNVAIEKKRHQWRNQ
jgi:hypothetical protein